MSVTIEDEREEQNERQQPADEEREYPSIKKALFGQDAKANMRCGVKWCMWQGSHAMVAVVGLVLMAVVTVLVGPFALVYGVIKTLAEKASVPDEWTDRIESGADSAVDRFEDTLEHPRMKQAGRVGAVLVMLALVVIILGLTIIIARDVYLSDPEATRKAVAGLLLGAVTLGAINVVWKYAGKYIVAGLAAVGSSASSSASKVNDKTQPAVERVSQTSAPVGNAMKKTGNAVSSASKKAGSSVSQKARETGEKASDTANDVAEKGGAVGKAAQNTPGVRRVYGNCPVSMNRAPKWYKKVVNIVEVASEKLGDES